MREKKRDTQFRGELEFARICSGGALCVALICFVLCSFADGVEPLCLTLRSRHFECFVSVVLSYCPLLMVYFGTPNMFITLWFGFDYGTNPPLGTLII
jgi:hypothetical protein